MHLRQGETDIEQTEMNHANEAKKKRLIQRDSFTCVFMFLRSCNKRGKSEGVLYSFL